MTMFRELYALASNATLTMVVSADEKTGKLTVSVLPKPKMDKGEVALSKHLTLTARPEEFDEGFIEALRGYRETRETLAAQAAATNKALEAAKALSAKKASEATSRAIKAAQASKASSPAAVEAADDERAAANSGDRAESNVQPGSAPGATPQLFG